MDTFAVVAVGAVALAFDVVDVEGEGGRHGDELRRGELRTRVTLNGRPVDDFNRHIASRNETPERIRLPIPAGLLRPGRNLLRIEQAGRLEEPEQFDDLGVLGIALESEAQRAPPAEAPQP